MGSDENQKAVFEFLSAHFETKEHFTRQDLEAVTTWKGQTLSTYLSKQMRPFLIDVPGGKFRVSEGFQRYANWEVFRRHVTQMRDASVDYNQLKFDIVRIYEFFMPLTNETYLRLSLDALFYRDTVDARLRTIDPSALDKFFPPVSGETREGQRDRVCNWISDKFGGYSIYHVDGRFRAQALATRATVGQSTSRYLVDETTAVTRFIFPCTNEQEAVLVEFLFENLFVKAITEVVNGEDEIWMVESGLKTQLHIWRITK